MQKYRVLTDIIGIMEDHEKTAYRPVYEIDPSGDESAFYEFNLVEGSQKEINAMSTLLVERNSILVEGDLVSGCKTIHKYNVDTNLPDTKPLGITFLNEIIDYLELISDEELEILKTKRKNLIGGVKTTFYDFNEADLKIKFNLKDNIIYRDLLNICNTLAQNTVISPLSDNHEVVLHEKNFENWDDLYTIINTKYGKEDEKSEVIWTGHIADSSGEAI
jgi:hypothetical protein